MAYCTYLRALRALGTALNCISVKTSARVQDVLATFKCAALVSIIVSGAVSAFRVNKLLDAPLFSGVTTASNIVRAIFAAATSYGGCSSIASLTEETTNPSRNLPLAYVTGVLILTLIYVLTNLAYFVVLDASTVASSEAIAVSFATVTWGQSAASCIPAIVSVSAFGSLCAIFFISARVELAAARQGHLPSVLSFINVNTSVPMVSLIVRGSFSLLYTFAGSLTFIIDSVSFVVSVNEIFTMICFFVLRFTMKDVPRPFRVATVIPVLYLTTLVTLLVGSLVNPSSYFQYIVVFVGYLTGGAYYIVFVRLKTNFPGEVLCYAELSTLLPVAGGGYAYITAGSRPLGRYGDVLPFMYAWSSLIIVDPMSAAFQGLTFASYALSILYGDCIIAYTTKLITALTFIGK
ncbi:Y+L amino acid transporter 2 [Ixodes scapularis]